ncbi:hypothetical protein LTR10_010162 [Elasticomyces elasticus]|nr:hypothetical protein LTR10_010162 [Elasticomyces elasticus]KAK4972067.1 hypothetical protein LTR42_006572 [Elasticomyces elasticus]
MNASGLLSDLGNPSLQTASLATLWNSASARDPVPTGLPKSKMGQQTMHTKAQSPPAQIEKRKAQNRAAQRTLRERNAANAKRLRYLEAELDRHRAAYAHYEEQISSLGLVIAQMGDEVRRGKIIVHALGRVYCAGRPHSISFLASLLADGLEEATLDGGRGPVHDTIFLSKPTRPELK